MALFIPPMSQQSEAPVGFDYRSGIDMTMPSTMLSIACAPPAIPATYLVEHDESMDIDTDLFEMNPGPNGIIQRSKIKSGPSQHEWDLHKDEIASLYSHMTLKQVMGFMYERHKFKASIKIYKTRLKQWRVGKYNKRGDVLAILRAKKRRELKNKHSTRFILRGHEVDIDDVERYAKRNRLFEPMAEFEYLQRAPTPPYLKCVSPRPEVSITPPTLWHAPDTFLRAFERFSNYQWREQECLPPSDAELERLKAAFFDAMDIGRDSAYKGAMSLAGRYWRSAFLMLESIIEHGDDSFLQNLLMVLYYYHLFQLSRTASLLVKHISHLARKYWQPEDPQFHVFIQLADLDLLNIDGFIDSFLALKVNLLEKRTSEDAIDGFYGRLQDASFRLHVWDHVDIRSAYPSLDEIDITHGATSLRALFLLRAQAYTYDDRGDDVECLRLNQEQLRPGHMTEDHSRRLTFLFYRHMGCGEAFYRTGRWTSSEWHFREASRLIEDGRGRIEELSPYMMYNIFERLLEMTECTQRLAEADEWRAKLAEIAKSCILPEALEVEYEVQ